MKKSDVLIIIPARGGSKGIPKKNLAKVGGTSLLAHSIKIAKNSKYGSNIVVSTDDANISQEANRNGAEVISRPKDISGDSATSEDTLLHALTYQNNFSKYKVLVMIQCTAPFTTSKDVDETIKKLEIENADSCFAAIKFNHFLWSRVINGASQPINHNGNLRKRRQDLEPQYLEAGSVYAMKIDAFLRDKNRFCGRTSCCEIPKQNCFEIDSYEDLLICRKLKV